MRTPEFWPSGNDFQKIILDTEADVTRLRHHLAMVQGQLKEDEIYDVLVDAAMYESGAEGELAVAMHYDYGNVEVLFSTPLQCEDFCLTMERLGKSIIRQLKDLGLYQNGACNYRYGNTCGSDLVLYSNEYYLNHITIPNIMECQ
jgi:hypothetical protein